MKSRKAGRSRMAEILKIDSSHPEPARIARAAKLLRQGEVIAIPTDTFYGLAANPFDLAAVEMIFSIKERFKGNPLLLLVDSVEMAAELSEDPPAQFYRLAKRFWPRAT
jgi:L-threonylcarbamoyladenylate synthase